MACGDVLSLEDLQTAKKHQIFEAEVITGKAGGIAGGADIDYATNQVTGQTQKTLPAVLRDAGFRPAPFTFATGGTLAVGSSDMAVLWPVSGGGDGQYYIWKGAYPKGIPAASSPATTGGVSAAGWLPFGDITLREDLAAIGGAELVGTSTGDTVEDRLQSGDVSQEYLNNLSFARSHKFGVMYELTHQFSGYSAIITAEGYNYLYATGHAFDHAANELWTAYQADGGDAAQWYVVYDLTTLAQKTYFKCGYRWTKSFNLHYTGSQRLLYGRGANTYLAIFDVTTLPSVGSTVAQFAQPKNNIGALFSSVMGDQLLVAHRGQTTNTVVQFNTYLVLDPSTFNHKRVFRLNTVAAGDTDGISSTLFKTQGLCFSPAGVAMSYGGFVSPSEAVTKAVTTDFRSIQGVALRSPEGVTQQAGLFDPFKAMPLMQGLGYTVNRFETEGLNYDSKTQKLSTIWHLNGNPDAKFLIVEAFSADEDALDLSSCAVSMIPNVPEVMSLYRDDQNGAFPHDPVTGQQMTDVSDLCKMMMRYDQREIVFYTSNFSGMTFNGAALIGSAKARLVRGTNTTFFFELRSSGADQQWVITVSGETFTYTRLDAYAVSYRFENTLTGDFIGNGDPNGVVVASPGSTYRNRLGGAGTALYVKETGAGTNTGWVAK